MRAWDIRSGGPDAAGRALGVHATARALLSGVYNGCVLEVKKEIPVDSFKQRQ
jgi:hypothetical protein